MCRFRTWLSSDPQLQPSPLFTRITSTNHTAFVGHQKPRLFVRIPQTNRPYVLQQVPWASRGRLGLLWTLLDYSQLALELTATTGQNEPHHHGPRAAALQKNTQKNKQFKIIKIIILQQAVNINYIIKFVFNPERGPLFGGLRQLAEQANISSCCRLTTKTKRTVMELANMLTRASSQAKQGSEQSRDPLTKSLASSISPSCKTER